MTSVPWRQPTPHSEWRARPSFSVFFFCRGRLGQTLNNISTKREKNRRAMCTRDLSPLSRALRYERNTGEVSCGFFWVLFECVFIKKSIFLKFPFGGGGGGKHGQMLSHWDRLPQELRQSIQWLADRQQAHDRLQRGWDKIHTQGFKDIC